MSKITSCGVLVKFEGRYVLGHATGQKHFDIFKGKMAGDETYAETAIRECQEESGLVFKEDELLSLGLHDYIKSKMLFIYIAKVSNLNMSDLKCSTWVDHTKLEMDYYATFDFDEMILNVGKSMSKLLLSLKVQIEEY
jgi:8-oxo-dGTP pyrophosphatase MutT (NUDIX family)